MLKQLFILILLLSIIPVQCSSNQNNNFKKDDSFTAKVIRIHDGDTITARQGNNKIKIRLAWIDCPEYNQAYGKTAKAFTYRLSYGKMVIIKVVDIDRYNRLVAFVILPNGNVLNEELLRAGLAWNYKRYSKSIEYDKLENQARKSKTGLWKRNKPFPPWIYRSK